eukprot:Phypoly_transcript_23309.p1 GENE.Phypoly_transcript_23309~~Phypoly_transcript_23309.p1  ORF type:complete len:188 (+),score=13.25 Phypoly_transcript_23309:46-564(+)
MTTIRRFTCDDLFRFNNINLDHLTETFNLGFYLQYLSTWPEMCTIAENPSGRPMGYMLGKAEGVGTNWHGHVTAVTVAPEFRRISLAERLMNILEVCSDKVHRGYFVDLFVRASNNVACNMYKKLGYTVYRRVLDYYSGEEDALDMRKALSRDKEKKSIVPLPRPVRADEVD